MLSFKEVRLLRGPHLLFGDATFTINTGEKIGVTGANGSGKSSLFALIRGELHEDSGSFSLPPRLTITHVAQETPALECAAIDYVLDGDVALRSIQAQMNDSTLDPSQHARLHSDFEHLEGYTAESRAARLLHGLGFKPGDLQRPVREFSGGWRVRLNLAQALMCRSDLLLLDEPTNHLDLEAILWLEDWLRIYAGTLLLISHDREFLDRVVDHILHIEHDGIQLHTGNYSDFELRRAEQMAQQRAAYSRQQREITRIHRFVDRFRAKASKARQAQSRLKTLARMELIAPAHADSPFDFAFRTPDKVPQPLLVLDDLKVGYGESVVVENIKLSLAPGDRIGLLGPNGAGKSSLIKVLAGELVPLAGTRLPADDLRVGYFAQHQLEQLEPSTTPLAHLKKLDRRAPEQELRTYLGGFGFGGDFAERNVEILSGGERARLVLAMLVYQRPNLLLLDEPTNHLDLEMRHALTVALQDFEGAIVLISHDRYLLRAATEQFLVIANGCIEPFNGDLDEYRDWLRNAENTRAQMADPREGEERDQSRARTSESAAERKGRKRLEAEARQRLAPLRARLRELESTIDQLTIRKQQLQVLLADPSFYTEAEKDRLLTLCGEQTQVNKNLTFSEEEWLRVTAALEAPDQLS